MQESVPVIPLEYAMPPPRPTVAQRGGPVVAWAMCLGAWLTIWLLDVESLLLSGPLIAAAGVGLIIIGGVAGHLFSILAGASYCSITLLLFVIVLANNWGPNVAELPFVILGGLFTLIMALPTAWAFMVESGYFRREAGA